MRKTFLCLLLVLLAFSTASAQYTIVMESRYYDLELPLRSFDTIIFPDRSVVQLFKTDQWNLKTLYLRASDHTGNELWLTVVDQAYWPTDFQNAFIEPLWDGSMIVAYTHNSRRNTQGLPRDLIVKRYSTIGTLMWEFNTHEAWPATRKKLSDLTILGMDTVLVAGFFKQSEGHVKEFLMAINAMSGQQIGTRIMDDNPQAYELRLAADISPSTVVYGYEEFYDHRDAMVTSYDLNGNHRWTYEFGDADIHSIDQDTDGNTYILTEESALYFSRTKLDAGGNLIWNYTNAFPLPQVCKLGSITCWRDGITILRWRNGHVQLSGPEGNLRFSEEMFNSRDSRHPVTVVSDQELLFGYVGYDQDLTMYYLGLVQYLIDDPVLASKDAERLITIVPGFELQPAYPNPFNSNTTLTLTTPTTGPVQVAVFDMLGRQVDYWSVPATNAGVVPITWSAHDNASGVYVIQLLTPDGHRATQRVTLIR